MKILLKLLIIVTLLGNSQLSAQIVDSIVLIKSNAGCPKWSPQGNQYIAYHTVEIDKNYDIHIMDSSGNNDTCITCDHPSLPNRHIGNHSWHPSGNWLTFIAEKPDYYLDSALHGLAKPGIGWNNDVYVISLLTGNVFPITDIDTKMGPFDVTPVTGVLGPHFSPDGTILTWSERIDTGGTYDWGEYVIRIADFEIVNDTPVISNVQTFQPATGAYLETNSFSSNSGTLYLCGNLRSGQTEYGIDIFSMNVSTMQIEDTITTCLEHFEECAHISPSDSIIAYLSTEGFPNDTSSTSWWQWAKGEFWFIDHNGSNSQQLTYFNTPGYPEYTGNRIIPAMVDWHHNERTLLLGIAEQLYPAFPTILEDKIYKVYLSDSYTGSSTINQFDVNNIFVFPNPSTDGKFEFNINLTVGEKFESIFIIDYYGRYISKVSIDSKYFEINSKGMYFLYVITSNGTYCKKIVFL